MGDYFISDKDLVSTLKYSGVTTFNFTGSGTTGVNVAIVASSLLNEAGKWKVKSAKVFYGFEQVINASSNGRFGFNCALTRNTSTSGDPNQSTANSYAHKSTQFDVRNYSSPDQVFPALDQSYDSDMTMHGSNVIRGGPGGDTIRIFVKGYRDSTSIIANSADVYVSWELELEPV